MNWRRRDSPSLTDLIRRIDTTQALAQAAADAHLAGSQGWSRVLQRAADRSYRKILAGVCGLSDDEADLLQPFVTDLEGHLDRLWWFWREPPERGSSQESLVFPRNG